MAGRKKNNITLFPPYETLSPDGYDKHYYRLTKALYESDAVKDLSELSFHMLMDIKMVARGHSEVSYTQAMAMERLQCCKASYTSGIKMLIKNGFIEKKPRGCYDPSKYKFSDKWKLYSSPRRDILTDKLKKQG